jgi:hypothetical protein
MHPQNDIRERFLQSFTAEILSHVKEIQDIKEFERKENERIKKEIETEKLKEKYSSYKKAPSPIISKVEYPIKNPPTLNIPQKVQTNPIQPAHIKKFPPRIITPQQIQTSSPQVNPPQIQNAIGEINFGKLLPLINDPLITSIECLGEDKGLVIKKSGAILKSPITLTKNEIESLINSFSEKTRIPIIEGMLRARSDIIELSGIISPTLNSTFIITKDRIVPALNRENLRNNLERPSTQNPYLNLKSSYRREQIEQEKKPDGQSFFNKKITIS